MVIKQSGKINAVLKSFFKRRNLVLDELRLRFCKTSTNIVLGHELSQDTISVSEIEKSKKFRYDWDENYNFCVTSIWTVKQIMTRNQVVTVL